MENEEMMEEKGTAWNGYATPGEKMAGDMSVLKSAPAFSDLDPEMAEQMKEKINGLIGSLINAASPLEAAMAPEKIKEAKDALNGLVDKGYPGVSEAMFMVNSMLPEQAPVGLGAIGKTIDGGAKVVDGLEKDDLGKTVEGGIQAGTGVGQLYATSQGFGPEAKVLGDAVTHGVEKGHLKETLNDLSNYGLGGGPVATPEKSYANGGDSRTTSQNLVDTVHIPRNAGR